MEISLYSNNISRKNLMHKEYDALLSLSNIIDLVIKKSDKGKSVVILIGMSMLKG